MAPLVRRPGAPRGQTPELIQKSGPREKVSVASALWVSPRRDRLGWFCRTRVKSSFDNWSSALFLEALLTELSGPVIVVGDGGSRPKGDPIRELEGVLAGRLMLEKLPPRMPRCSTRWSSSGVG